MDNRSVNEAGRLDQLAVGLSGLCLTHCLLLPVVIALMPFLGQLDDDHLHVQMLVVVLPVSLIALTLGFRRHRNAHLFALGVAGLALLVFGGTIAHNLYGVIADRVFTIAGSITLAVTHYRNSRLSRRCAAVRSSAIQGS
jgi:hypothetical protein